MFIVLGMNNFGAHIKMMARTIYNYRENGFFAHYFLKINNALSFDKFKIGRFGTIDQIILDKTKKQLFTVLNFAL